MPWDEFAEEAFCKMDTRRLVRYCNEPAST